MLVQSTPVDARPCSDHSWDVSGAHSSLTSHQRVSIPNEVPAIGRASTIQPELVDLSLTVTDTLTCAELAAALNAAETTAPVRELRSLSTDQVRRLAAAGLARIGLHRVREIARETLRLNRIRLDKWELHLPTTAEDAEIRRMWPSKRRETLCWDLASRIVMARPARQVAA